MIALFKRLSKRVSLLASRVGKEFSLLSPVSRSGSYNDLNDTPSIPNVPKNVSAFTNDAGYLTQHQSLEGYATTHQVDAKLDKSGGTMTGVIEFADDQTLPIDIQQDGQSVISGEFIDKENATICNLSSFPSSVQTYDLSGIIPDDGYIYEGMFRGVIDTTSSSGSRSAIYLKTDLMSVYVPVCRVRTPASGSSWCGGTVNLPIGLGRKLMMSDGSSYTASAVIVMLSGIRRLYKARGET